MECDQPRMTGERLAGYINSLPDHRARTALARCGGGRHGADAMLAGRPVPGDAALFAAAEREWWALRREDWLEAFGHHPRIGERASDPWARSEQAGVRGAGAGAGDETRAALAQGNRADGDRFGYVFVACASAQRAGRPPDAHP